MYNNEFFFEIKDGSAKSADKIAPIVIEKYFPQTVVDVGCGQGWWAKAFEDRGCTVVGIDGAYVDNPVIPFIAHDISIDLPPLAEKYDLAVCLEVAEHLPENRAESFIKDLCSYSDTILFSAAIPFQTGTHHINCQWLSYWTKIFNENNYGLQDFIRFKIWNDNEIESWYKQNIVVFKNGKKNDNILDVVHPEIHYWGRV